jgi:DNA polymerase I-like protein with 3'-5' exonuclease and polymerase domains
VLPDADKWKIPYKLYTETDEAIAVLEQLTRTGSELFTCDIECSHTGWDNQNMLLLGIKPLENQEVQIIGNFNKHVCDKLNAFYKQSSPFNWHNGKFDVGRMHRMLGVRARVDEDTMLLHYCGINEKKGTHGLKDLAPIYLNAPHWDDELDEYKHLYAKRNRIAMRDFRYDYIPRDILVPYLAMDCAATEQLLFKFRKLARPESAPVYANLVKSSNVYAVIEENGNYVDQDHLNNVHIDLAQQIEEAEDILEVATRRYWNAAKYMRDTGAKSAGTYFNYKSPKQLAWMLKEVTGANIGSTDKDALEELFEKYPEVQFLRALMSLRKLQKMLGTYVDGIREAVCSDGRVHASYNLHGTETGRLSCSNPNMQNIPRDKKIKNIFSAAPGNILVQLDYSQAELRCLAYLSDDDWLTGVFERDEDLHDSVATAMFGPNFTKEERVKAKTVNFGIAYGRGAQSLMLEFGISLTAATDIIARWFEPMPKVKAWIEDVRTYPMTNRVFTTPFGRQRTFVVTNANYNAVQNESINFPDSRIHRDLTVFCFRQINHIIIAAGN